MKKILYLILFFLRRFTLNLDLFLDRIDLPSTKPNKSSLYQYKGERFELDDNTANKLNYALGLNQKEERYEKVN